MSLQLRDLRFPSYFKCQRNHTFLKILQSPWPFLLPLTSHYLRLQLIFSLLDQPLTDTEVVHRVDDVKILKERVQFDPAVVFLVFLDAGLEDPIVEIEVPGEINETSKVKTSCYALSKSIGTAL